MGRERLGRGFEKKRKKEKKKEKKEKKKEKKERKKRERKKGDGRERLSLEVLGGGER